jgi:hypothetical protein
MKRAILINKFLTVILCLNFFNTLTVFAQKRNVQPNEIVEILALNAFEHFYNALTIPLGIKSDGLRQIAETGL